MPPRLANASTASRFCLNLDTMVRILLAVLTAISPLCAESLTYEGKGSDDITYKVDASPEAVVITATGKDLDSLSLFVAIGKSDFTGSLIVPYGKGTDGSSVVLPFLAGAILSTTPQGDFLRLWQQTRWGERLPAEKAFASRREANSISLTIPKSLSGPLESLRIAAYLKDPSAAGGWGRLLGTPDPTDRSGTGDITLRSYIAADSGSLHLESREHSDTSKIRIYQFLPRHFGNTNETRKPNGSLAENGCGKFSDLNPLALAALKDMGITHLWPTGVLQQATATDYSSIGEPADDPDLLKGLAGSPYAIRDYFDVSPDYADDPANRLKEFRAMISRTHEAGLKVLMDFVPNHVARSYHSSIRPDLSFGANDDRTKFFAPDNNFFWLKPDAKGPPLRLPTVDASGQPSSPTCKVAGLPCDGLYEPEAKNGRVTGNNLASWQPDAGSWYETVKLNYGYDFSDPSKSTRAYPHGDKPNLPIPDTWGKMDEIIAYWQEFGVDGFRVDMAHMVPPEFWQWLISRAHARNPQVFFMAEAYNDDPAKVPSGDPLVAEVGGGNVMFDLLNAGFDAVYDDATYDKLKDVYDHNAWANDLDALRPHPLVFDNSLRYAENHDEVRLAGKGNWANTGAAVGRPVTALLFARSRGPVMLYSGQEVGEPADGAEGFGGDDARTSIFDYWSMPEFTKWVNGGAFDGGRLSAEQKDLRDFYARLTKLTNEPAFRNGNFLPLNPANIENPQYGRLPGEQASGHWLYSFLRADPSTGQKFLVVINLHPRESLENIRILLPPEASMFLSLKDADTLRLTDKLSNLPALETTAANWKSKGLSNLSLPPFTAAFYEVTSH